MSGKLTLISSATASGSSSVEFTSGLTDYDEIIFYFVNVQHSHDDRFIEWQVSTATSSYNETITSTFFLAQQHYSWSTEATLYYDASRDLAQSTLRQKIHSSADNGGTVTGASASGEMHLFGCGSSSKVKHFYSRLNNIYYIEGAYDTHVAGYINQTDPITKIKFQPDGNTFSGEFYMYGVS